MSGASNAAAALWRCIGAAGWLLCGLVLAVQSFPAQAQQSSGACSPIVKDTTGNVRINIDCRSTLSDQQLEALMTAVVEALARRDSASARELARRDSALARELRTLSAAFGVQESALGNFFKILDENRVPIEDMDKRLREIAKRHLELIERLRLAERSAPDDPDVGRYLKLAKGFIEKGDYDGADGLLARAEALDIEAIARQQTALDKRALRAAETRGERAELRLIRFDYRAAANLFAAAANIVPANRPLTVARYVDRAGTAYKDAGLYPDALPHYRRSLALREKHLDPNDPTIAVALNNLAALYQTTSRYAEAEPLIKRALKIDEAKRGPDHPNVAIRLNNLADL